MVFDSTLFPTNTEDAPPLSAQVFEESRADDMSARAAQPQAWDPDDDVSEGSTDSSEAELTTEAKYYLAMQRGKIRN